MSIFGNILSRIFKTKADDMVGTTDTTPGGKPRPGEAAVTAAPAAPAAPAPAVQAVDIEQVLNDMAAKNPQKLNWRTSIVDLMKLVGMESSLAERKQLADELGYTGDKSDSASMNIWLHKQVMKKLADNGGKLPADLQG